VECVFRRKDAGAPRMGAREFDGCFDAFAARRSKECSTEPSAGPLAQFLGEFPGQIRNVRLNHRRTAPRQLQLQCPHDIGMVVAYVVNAVSGKKIEDTPSFCSE
jgi:hypothetical protein